VLASIFMDDKLAQLKKCRDSFPFFAESCLKIRNKAGDIEPLRLNESQLFVHTALEKQKAEKGYVRALVLKGRQQGISTLVGARYYHKAVMRKGTSVFILAHEQQASDALFDIVDRFQRHNPIAPHVGVSNTKELVFDRLESTYIVATAGAKEGGRSRTISLFHGSEVPLWANAKGHFAASVQTVPLLPDTEVILEGTSAGFGGEFYERWQDAEAGKGDYICVFLPWFMAREYARTPEDGFELATDAEEGEMSEAEYAATFGLSLAQMAWRRGKIQELRSKAAFCREYPATPSEAWTASADHEPFIPPVSVLRARKRKVEGVGPLVLGVDPASMGGDRFSIAARRGGCVLWVEHRNKIDHLEGTAWIRSLIDDLRPARVNIDSGNIGRAIVTGLKSIGPDYANIVRGVDFGGTSEHRLARPKVPGPKNRRAEMWERMRDWLALEEGVAIPDDEAIQTDMCSPRLKPQLDNTFLLEKKEDMKKRGVRSPDLADAVALTFAFKEFIKDYVSPKKTSTFGNLDAQRELTPAPWSPEGYSGGSNGWMGI
jgi:hypothetical protein